MINIRFGNNSQGNRVLTGENRPIIEEVNVPRRQCIKKKVQKRIIVQPGNSTESDGDVNEEINVCILKRKTPKRTEKIVDNSNVQAIKDKKQNDSIEEVGLDSSKNLMDKST